jgi:hypothetical protein
MNIAPESNLPAAVSASASILVPASPPTSEFILRRIPESLHARNQRATRLIWGIGGLTCFTLLLAAVIPLEIKLIEWWNPSQPNFLFVLSLIAAIVLPAISSLSIAVWSALFHTGGVTLRFLLSLATASLVLVILLLLVEGILGPGPEGIFSGSACAFFGVISGIATVAVGIQFWTGWSLISEQQSQSMTRRLTIRDLLELTFVIAVCCAVMSRLELSPLLWENACCHLGSRCRRRRLLAADDASLAIGRTAASPQLSILNHVVADRGDLLHYLVSILGASRIGCVAGLDRDISCGGGRYDDEFLFSSRYGHWSLLATWLWLATVPSAPGCSRRNCDSMRRGDLTQARVSPPCRS